MERLSMRIFIKKELPLLINGELVTILIGEYETVHSSGHSVSAAAVIVKCDVATSYSLRIGSPGLTVGAGPGARFMTIPIHVLETALGEDPEYLEIGWKKSYPVEKGNFLSPKQWQALLRRVRKMRSISGCGAFVTIGEGSLSLDVDANTVPQLRVNVVENTIANFLADCGIMTERSST
jgi:hypothetical protein